MANVILGLGSNLGYKLNYLREAASYIEKDIGKIKKISSIYQTKALLPEGAPDSWDSDYYNLALEVQTMLEPESLLEMIKRIESKIGRDPNHLHWSPREIDIDILSYDDRVYQSDTLVIPHKLLLTRRFALEPLLEIAPNWQHPEYPKDLYLVLKALPELKIAPYTLTGSKVMGIINLSRDSFSEDESELTRNTPYSIKRFLQTIQSMIEEGAEVIDIGAESTKPNATPKTADEVWCLLKPYLEALDTYLKDNAFPVPIDISIDTYHASVVKKALSFPCVRIINDVYGCELEEIAQLIKNTDIKYVFMHQMGKAGGEYVPQKDKIVESVIHFAREKISQLAHLGISQNQMIFDVGIGFGKSPFQTNILLNSISEIKAALSVSILVGHSRKNSICPYVKERSLEQKDLSTAITSYILSQAKVDYLRVHNVNYSVIANWQRNRSSLVGG
ncbi:dihydropteroate synthase [Fangia hongkongensis]|uniref:dihydropteroate synthase n=1 Tax=Fangia hongkongensis TaxID=270495 RepID=UPI00036F1164|nr:dihydropteroate synthase [Fangia hongkongensis]MBK2123636.1 dihydropteroate synthase [Fangia hongkongensis]